MTRLAAVLAVACALGACGPRRVAGMDATTGADTLRGVVREVGSEPGTMFVLTTATGEIYLLGERPILRRMVGLEVMVAGRPAPDGFHVGRAVVRAAGGLAAVDGVLGRDQRGFFLVPADGGARIPLPHLPEQLRGRLGTRIWLSGPLDRVPDSFGEIDP